MGGPKESMRLYSDSPSLVEHAQRRCGRNTMLEEENANQEKLVEHIIGLLRRLVSAFREGNEP